jgi:hypothetical protein
MKAHSSQLLSIEEIVNKVLLDLGESAHLKEKFLSFGVSWFKKWRKDMAREVKKTTLEMTPWKSVVLPNDCVDWIQIGVKNGESFDTFTNKKLNPRDCACDDDEPIAAEYCPEQGSEGLQLNDITEFGEDPGKLYGLKSKDNGLGYFEPNRIQGSNEIQLSASVRSGTPIMLVYLATLLNPDVDLCVHPYAQDAMETFIHWKNLQMKKRAGARNINQEQIDEAKREYDNELCLLAEIRMDLNAETIMELVRDSYMLSPKH